MRAGLRPHPFLEFHHIVPWAEGGATELANLLPLCSGCHGLIAAGTMTVHIDADPDLTRFRFPDGDEHLLQVWDNPDSFDEPREGEV